MKGGVRPRSTDCKNVSQYHCNSNMIISASLHNHVNTCICGIYLYPSRDYKWSLILKIFYMNKTKASSVIGNWCNNNELITRMRMNPPFAAILMNKTSICGNYRRQNSEMLLPDEKNTSFCTTNRGQIFILQFQSTTPNSQLRLIIELTEWLFCHPSVIMSSVKRYRLRP